MKKLLIVLVSVAAFGFIGSQALACMWDGYWGGPMGGSWGCGYYSNVNPGGSHQKFLNDTSKIRGELAAKQGEYNALMAQPNPDPKRAGKLSQEIAALHDQLKATAQTYDLSTPRTYSAPPMGYSGYGRGYNGWGCW